jgi:hypothetical protein
MFETIMNCLLALFLSMATLVMILFMIMITIEAFECFKNKGN